MVLPCIRFDQESNACILECEDFETNRVIRKDFPISDQPDGKLQAKRAAHQELVTVVKSNISFSNKVSFSTLMNNYKG